MATATMKLEAALGTEAFDWRAFDPEVFDCMTDLSADVLGSFGVRFKYGISGNGPLDSVAGPGQLECFLRNDAGNSGGQQGYYSPLHASKRTGWTFGVPIRLSFTFNGVTYTKFIGKARVIDPVPGVAREQHAHVIAFDFMRDLMEADVREVVVQESQTEAELLQAILDAVPADSQPVSVDLDAGVDTYPYAFDDLGGGAKALALLNDVAISAFAFLAMRGDGTLFSLSRHSRTLSGSQFTYDDDMHGLAVPSSLDKVFNRVRVTIHPKTVDAAATTVLYALTGAAPAIAPGETIEIWGNYRDPNDTTRKIGGTAVVDPLVASTDYTGNSQADGGGSDLTADLAVDIDPFASTAKFTIQNTGSQTVFVTSLQCRGKGIYDDGPQTLEAYTVKPYGDRVLPIDLPYQDDLGVGLSAASYIVAQYGELANQVESLTFIANVSDAFMEQALAREPGDRITISETVTGLTSVDAIIQSVEFQVRGGVWILCTWGLAPASPFNFWQLGVAGASEVGVSTVLGF
ncbi:MAG: hypothetical protein AB7Q16_24795 [Vicinamibacterales bacterium]